MAVQLLSVLTVFVALSAAANRPPLIFVPGLTESDLLSSFTPSFKSHYPFCKNSSLTPQLLWPIFNNEFKKPEDILCYLEKFQTIYDPSKNQYNSQTGIKASTIDFGGFQGIGGGDKVSQLYSKLGWVAGKNFFCAPFDWRFPTAGGAQDAYYGQLKALVERVFSQTQQKVTLAAVSFGPQITLGFLHRMTQAWKDQYIAKFVAESPVWSGAPIAVGMLVGLDNTTALTRQIALRTYSDMWLFPQAGTTNTTFGSSDILVETPSKRYTAFDYSQLMTDLGFSFLVPGMEAAHSSPDLNTFDPPGVDTLVTYGYGIDTAQSFLYAADFVQDPSASPYVARVVNAPDTGDSIVTLRSSLRAQYAWPDAFKAAGKQLLHRGYFNQTHAYCFFNGTQDTCFQDVLNWIVNGTVPPAEPEQRLEMAQAEPQPARPWKSMGSVFW